MGTYGSSKIAGQFLVEVLSKELGARGVTVNSILPTATDGAGVGRPPCAGSGALLLDDRSAPAPTETPMNTGRPVSRNGRRGASA
jgi:NAD(P)-dependent dehydrogenase (short-subunit alcohol dehydrogenase family)